MARSAVSSVGSHHGPYERWMGSGRVESRRSVTIAILAGSSVPVPDPGAAAGAGERDFDRPIIWLTCIVVVGRGIELVANRAVKACVNGAPGSTHRVGDDVRAVSTHKNGSGNPHSIEIAWRRGGHRIAMASVAGGHSCGVTSGAANR